MRSREHLATAVLSALRLAEEHGGATTALSAGGVAMTDLDRFGRLADDLDRVVSGSEGAVAEALALGFLAGRVAQRPRARLGGDPSSFLMDRDLVVRGAMGESVLRLPWIDEEMFVGRPVPDITEMPDPLRKQCVEHYTAALAGQRGSFAFSSYGHAYTVDAVPVHGRDGSVDGVLGIAVPIDPAVASAAAYERTADSLDRTGRDAEERAERHRRSGEAEAERAEQRAAAKARRNATRLRAGARRLRTRAGGGMPEPPSITRRETEVLALASLGLTSAEIAEQLVVSVGTIKTHLQNIYPKLGVTDKASAVAEALRHGLID